MSTRWKKNFSPTPRRTRRLSPPRRKACALAAGALIVAFAVTLHAQSPSPSWPFPSRSPASAATPSAPRATRPPYDVPLRQERFEALPNHEISPAGEQALAMQPAQWRHGETDNFIIHYRSMSDALQVAREIEFDLWYVAQSLGAQPEQYARKSHVYIFRDEKEWQKFLVETRAPGWVHSFALARRTFPRIARGGRRLRFPHPRP